MLPHNGRVRLYAADGPRSTTRRTTRYRLILPKRLGGLAFTALFVLAACQPRIVIVTHDVTREVPVTVMVHTEDSSTPDPVLEAMASNTPPKVDSLDSSTPGEEAPILTSPGRAPHPGAPACEELGEAHNNHEFHTLWDDVHSCHFDHEHGENPLTSEVATTFPDFDLRTLLGNVSVGHTNPSSPMENTHKHGGFKWQVLLRHPHGCEGFEGSDIGVDASVIQYHAFGDYAVEFESRVHSALILLRQCRAENPSDYGYLFTVQHVDYGQRVAPYQGQVLDYPDNPKPTYDSGLGPYFTLDCIGGVSQCRESRLSVLQRNLNANSIWTSEPRNLNNSGSHLFELLFRVRDTYQLLDWSDQRYPFTFVWLCSEDDGRTYSPVAGCGYNNSTTRVQEINGTVPDEWDNLAGFDIDPREGRITAEGYTTKFGELNSACTAPGPDCHPVKMIGVFVGFYGSYLIEAKERQFDPVAQPERDIYFCKGQVCREGDADALPSGWIGSHN